MTWSESLVLRSERSERLMTWTPPGADVEEEVSSLPVE